MRKINWLRNTYMKPPQGQNQREKSNRWAMSQRTVTVTEIENLSSDSNHWRMQWKKNTKTTKSVTDSLEVCGGGWRTWPDRWAPSRQKPQPWGKRAPSSETNTGHWCLLKTIVPASCGDTGEDPGRISRKSSLTCLAQSPQILQTSWLSRWTLCTEQVGALDTSTPAAALQSG